MSRSLHVPSSPPLHHNRQSRTQHGVHLRGLKFSGDTGQGEDEFGQRLFSDSRKSRRPSATVVHQARSGRCVQMTTGSLLGNLGARLLIGVGNDALHVQVVVPQRLIARQRQCSQPENTKSNWNCARSSFVEHLRCMPQHWWLAGVSAPRPRKGDNWVLFCCAFRMVHK